MFRKFAGLAVALVSLAVSACAGNAGGSGTATVMLPHFDNDLIMYATVPKDTIGEELPGEGLGQIKSVKWQATLGGFTQQHYSQSLGFKPGTKITVVNLSKSITHTLDVVKEIDGPPADFPKAPKLSIPAKGGSKLMVGYASGPIKPGKSVTVTLEKGVYLIGCAFHYADGMRDVLVVSDHTGPGQQATPSASSTPRSHSSYEPRTP
jgi:plastocyanin